MCWGGGIMSGEATVWFTRPDGEINIYRPIVDFR